MKKYYYASFTYLILGMLAGVFYRELTRISGYQQETVLRGVHTHILVLGFIFFLVVLLLDKAFGFRESKSEKAWFIGYNLSFICFIITMVIRGTAQVKGFDVPGLSHMAGLTHALQGISMIWFMVLLGKAIGIKEK